jgi:prophage regulatory protein
MDQHESLLKLPEVIRRVGMGRSKIYSEMKDGNFPQSIQRGVKDTVWIGSQIDKYVQEVISKARVVQ